MDEAMFVELIERDVDDISKAASRLPLDERRRTIEIASTILSTRQPRVRALKIMRFVQAALAQEINARFPIAKVRAISSAVMATAAATSASDVHRAAVDVISLLAVKATAERNNLAVMARLLEKSPREPYGPQTARKSEPARPAVSVAPRLKRTS